MEAYIVATACTKFDRKPNQSFKNLTEEVYLDLLKNAGLENGNLIGQAWFGNCGMGTFGQRNIRGQVLDNNRNGLPGVSVLLVKEGKPPIIRTTISNSKGEYYFNSTPIGKYSLGYSKLGFKSILVNETNTGIETAFGNQVKTYVESGSSVKIPAVILRSLGAFGLAFEP